MQQHSMTGLLKLSLFLGLSHFAHIIIGFTDIAMAGWLGQTELATVALAASLFYVIILTVIGFIAGLSPLLAKYEASGDQKTCLKITQFSVYFVLLFSIIGACLLYIGDDVLRLAQQPKELVEHTPVYFLYLIPSIFSIVIFGFLWVFASIRGQSHAIFWVSFSSIFINILCNYVFMFGAGPITAMGIAGLGLSTFVAVSFKALVLYVWLKAHNRLGTISLNNPFRDFDKNQCKQIFVYGLPMAALECITIGIFHHLTFYYWFSGCELYCDPCHYLANRGIGRGIHAWCE